MQNFVTQFGGIIGIITTVVVGGFAIYGAFNKNSKILKKEESDTAKDVIGLLKDQVDALEKKVDDQGTEIKELTDKVQKLTDENKTLRDVLQGRDGETKQFYKDAYEAMKVIGNISQRAEHNDEVSEENSRTLSKIVALLEAVLKSPK